MKIQTQAKYLAALMPFMSREETRYYLNGINIRPVNGPKKKGIVLCATDGHTLGAIYDEEGTADAEYTLPLVEMKDLAAAIKKKSRAKNSIFALYATAGIFAVEDGVAYVMNDYYKNNPEAGFSPVTEIGEHHLFISHIKPIDGTFPAYQKVFCSTYGGFVDNSAFNVDLMNKFATPARILRGEFAKAPMLNMFYAKGKPVKQGRKMKPEEKGDKHEQGGYGDPLLIRIEGVDNFYGQIMPIRAHIKDDSYKKPEWVKIQE